MLTIVNMNIFISSSSLIDNYSRDLLFTGYLHWLSELDLDEQLMIRVRLEWRVPALKEIPHRKLGGFVEAFHIRDVIVNTSIRGHLR